MGFNSAFKGLIFSLHTQFSPTSCLPAPSEVQIFPSTKFNRTQRSVVAVSSIV